MSRIILYLLLIKSCVLCAQDLNYLGQQDTLYMIFKKPEKLNAVNEPYQKFNLLKSFNGELAEYGFEDLDTINRFVFVMVRENPTVPLSDLNIEINRKKFLMENHNRIVDLNFIKNYTPRQFFFYGLGLNGNGPLRKVVYVIDEEALQRKDKNIVLRKADIVALGYLGI